MGLCKLSPKATAIIAGILTLLQGLIWSIIGTLSLLVYSCSINITEDLSSLFYRFYLIYLYSGECGPVNVDIETDNGTISFTWPTIGVQAADRTYALIIVYLTLSLLWVISALLLIIATISDITRIRGVILRSPWLILTSLLIILDVIASVYYSIDISSISNLVDLLKFVGLQLESQEISSSTNSTSFGLITAPSILALVIFCRVIIGWILNLVFLMYVGQDVRNGESPLKPSPPEPRRPYQEYLKKLSTIGPVPDVKWDPYQRKRSDLPVLKPLEKPSPPNERKRKQSDYQQYLFYAKKSSQLDYLDDIKSEPPTPSPGLQPTTTGVWRVSTPQLGRRDEINNWQESENSEVPVPIPAPDYESNNFQENLNFANVSRSPTETLRKSNDEKRY